jgi:hypothetical protein
MLDSCHGHDSDCHRVRRGAEARARVDESGHWRITINPDSKNARAMVADVGIGSVPRT